MARQSAKFKSGRRTGTPENRARVYGAVRVISPAQTVCKLIRLARLVMSLHPQSNARLAPTVSKHC